MLTSGNPTEKNLLACTTYVASMVVPSSLCPTTARGRFIQMKTMPKRSRELNHGRRHWETSSGHRAAAAASVVSRGGE